ncbi:hypothetical protein EV715DRAFT_202247 [Schizophyllum commune]
MSEELQKMSGSPSRKCHLLNLPVELADKICRYVGSGDASKKQMADVALTCGALYGVANRILWEDLPGLEPLLNAMPAGTWEDSAALEESDLDSLTEFWQPIRHLAAHVKAITIYPIPLAQQEKIMRCTPSRMARNLSHYKNLKRVDFDLPFSPHPEILEGLAAMPTLSFVSIKFYAFLDSGRPKWIGRRPKFPQHSFPALEHLYLKGASFADAKALLESDDRSMLRAISIASPEQETSTTLVALLETIKCLCTPAYLREALFTRLLIYDAENEWPVTFEHVKPLTSFSGLESVGFGRFCGMEITEEQWIYMAQLWPNLRTLEMLCHDKNYQPALALCSIATIAAVVRLCPSLECLKLPFDFSNMPVLPDGVEFPRHTFKLVLAGMPSHIKQTYEDVIDFLDRALWGVIIDLAYDCELDAFRNEDTRYAHEQWTSLKYVTDGTHRFFPIIAQGTRHEDTSEDEAEPEDGGESEGDTESEVDVEPL